MRQGVGDLRERITHTHGKNTAQRKIQHVIENAFSGTAISLLLEERDDGLRQCEWILENGHFRASGLHADYKTTGWLELEKRTERGDQTAQPVAPTLGHPHIDSPWKFLQTRHPQSGNGDSISS